MNKKLNHRFVWALLAFSTLIFSSLSQAQKSNADKVVLTINGKDKKHTLSMATLKALPQQTFVTKTPWYPDSVKFSGPLLRDVLALAKVKGTDISAIALDDYKVQIPMSDAQQYDMILAHKINDETIPVKTKGPLFVVYPYDSKPELQALRFYERSIWQLKALTVK
jgi:hypothetical protein